MDPTQRDERKQKRAGRKAARAELKKKKKELRPDDAADVDRNKARLLAKLCLCDDEALDRFAGKRLPEGCLADAELLSSARELLQGVAEVILGNDERAWERLEAARDVLLEESAPAPAEETLSRPNEPQRLDLPAGEAPATEAPSAPEAADRTPEVSSKPSSPALAAPAWPAPAPGAPAPAAHDGASSPWVGATPAAVHPKPAPAPPAMLSPPARASASEAPPALVEQQPDNGERAGYSPLPFSGTNQPPPRAVAAKTEDRLDATLAGDEATAGRDAGLPFRAANSDRVAPAAPAVAAPVFPNLTFEQFAALCAERDVGHTDLDELRRKFSLASEAAHRALEEHWRQRLHTDRALAQRFDGLVASYRAWLEQHG